MNKKANTISAPFKSPKEIDYKDVYKLKKYVTTRGRIIEAEKSGLSQAAQRKLALSIKRARYMALLPFNNYGV
ncbi:MAG: 30S ribosomal protein S18 [Candidatus Dojkabacteria bacterium]